MFGQDFDVKVWSKDFEFWNLIKICVRTCFFGKQNSTLGSVVPLAMFYIKSLVNSSTFLKRYLDGCHGGNSSRSGFYILGKQPQI